MWRRKQQQNAAPSERGEDENGHDEARREFAAAAGNPRRSGQEALIRTWKCFAMFWF
jgi:hypothetical protein